MPDFSKIWATNSPLPEFNFTDSEYLTGWDFVAASPPTKSQFDAWFKLTDQKLQWLYNQLQNTASQIYPVGAVYISVNSTSPASLFGGVWERLKDTFLLANGDTYAADTTGGSATKTITVNNLPAHNHTVNSSGAHTHSATTSSAGGNHTHARGSMEIVGSITSNDHTGTFKEALTLSDSISSSGALSVGNYVTVTGYATSKDDNGAYRTINFRASNGWSGATSTTTNHTHTVSLSGGAHTHTTNNTGGSQPINIMPPYTTVYVWRRTA